MSAECDKCGHDLVIINPLASESERDYECVVCELREQLKSEMERSAELKYRLDVAVAFIVKNANHTELFNFVEGWYMCRDCKTPEYIGGHLSLCATGQTLQKLRSVVGEEAEK